MVSSHDMVGHRYGKLTVLEVVGPNEKAHSYWIRCRCDCGVVRDFNKSSVISGATRSCGCYRKAHARVEHIRHGMGNGDNRLYGIWRNIKSHCYNPNDRAYARYGAKGITMCDEWRTDFMAFHTWSMTHGYEDTLTMDRIDLTKGYGPDNCRWVTRRQQANNTSRNRIYEYDGKRMTVAQWAEHTGIRYHTLIARLNSGYPPEIAFTAKRLSKHKSDDGADGSVSGHATNQLED